MPGANIVDRISAAYFELHQLKLASQLPLHTLSPGFVREGAFVRLIIGLRDVLRFLDDFNLRLDFDDDLPNGDITDVVYKMRNACCHLGSSSRNVFVEGTRVSFAVGYPGSNVTFRRPGRDDVAMGCPYPDDLSYHYGRLTLLHNRHIVRAVNESKSRLDSLAAEHGVTCPSWYGEGQLS